MLLWILSSPANFFPKLLSTPLIRGHHHKNVGQAFQPIPLPAGRLLRSAPPRSARGRRGKRGRQDMRFACNDSSGCHCEERSDEAIPWMAERRTADGR